MDAGDDDDDAAPPAAPSMFKPEAFTADEVDMTPDAPQGDEGQEDGEAEDLMGDDFDADGDEREAAEAQRKAKELERSRANDPELQQQQEAAGEEQTTEGASAAAPSQGESSSSKPKERPQMRRDVADTKSMDVDEPETRAEAAAVKTENGVEDEEEPDPLDAYMNSVSTEVKQINAQDRQTKSLGRSESKGVKISGEDEADEAEGPAPELSDMDKIGLNTQDIMACVAVFVFALFKERKPLLTSLSADWQRRSSKGESCTPWTTPKSTTSPSAKPSTTLHQKLKRSLLKKCPTLAFCSTASRSEVSTVPSPSPSGRTAVCPPSCWMSSALQAGRRPRPFRPKPCPPSCPAAT